MKTGSHEELMRLVAVAHEFRGSDAMLHVCGLLESLEAGYKEQLADVAAADLSRLQGALKQVKHLRNAILHGTSPRL